MTIGEPAEERSLTPATLQTQLLAAHRNDDNDALTELYAQAADLEQARGNIDAMCFFLTQAYVYALQAGHPEGKALHARLTRHGRI